MTRGVLTNRRFTLVLNFFMMAFKGAKERSPLMFPFLKANNASLGGVKVAPIGTNKTGIDVFFVIFPEIFPKKSLSLLSLLFGPTTIKPSPISLSKDSIPDTKSPS